jgi:Bacterial capsule synthesis protein PGA_cap
MALLAVLIATVASPAAVAGQGVGTTSAAVTSSAAAAGQGVGTPKACPAPCRRFKIAWAGDVFLGDAVQPYLDRNGYAWPFAFVRPLLDADYAVGNAEGPITSRTGKYFPKQRWSYNARPFAAAALANVGFKAMNLSNNHALDRGPGGLADSIRHLRAAGIAPFGAGMDLGAAAAPLLIHTPFGAVAVVGISERWTYGSVAGPHKPGTVPLARATIAREKALAKSAGARWVVAFVHWGKNYAPITDKQRRFAALFAAAGYDLVIGHHAHVQQPVELIDGMPVLYSLGNFAFGSPGRFSEKMPGYGLVADTILDDRGFSDIQLTCIVTDNSVVKFQPRPCGPGIARSVIKGLGPAVKWEHGKGVVRLRRDVVGPVPPGRRDAGRANEHRPMKAVS